MEYSILVKGHDCADWKKATEHALKVIPGESVSHLIDRAGIGAHNECVELRLQWEGRQVQPESKPPLPPVVEEVVQPTRRKRKALKRRGR